MATLRDIRQRISSLKSTQKITRAMKMVAGAKMRRVQLQLAAGRDYAEELLTVTSIAVGSNRDPPLLLKRRRERICYVLITGDRGLCGSFNANLIHTAEEELEKYKDRQPLLVTIGRKGYEHFSRLQVPSLKSHNDFFNHLNCKLAGQIAGSLMHLFLTREVDQIWVIYHEFHSLSQQGVVVRPLLPLPLPRPPAGSGFLFEPRPADLVETFAPKAVAALLYRMLLESFTAEQAARMAAMEQATENAEEMIRELVLFYNKARQAAITKELSEIVGSAEALRQ
ncbi:MAG: ATP synthase F1 subunit gamma [candidate division KSB1 bacterium]|nr:ATP synthase F1 subunit gamma [candidate division KSB1 bacterium]